MGLSRAEGSLSHPPGEILTARAYPMWMRVRSAVDDETHHPAWCAQWSREKAGPIKRGSVPFGKKCSPGCQSPLTTYAFYITDWVGASTEMLHTRRKIDRQTGNGKLESSGSNLCLSIDSKMFTLRFLYWQAAGLLFFDGLSAGAALSRLRKTRMKITAVRLRTEQNRYYEADAVLAGSLSVVLIGILFYFYRACQWLKDLDYRYGYA